MEPDDPQCLAKFEAGVFAAGEQAYRAIPKSFPEDSLARLMIAECRERQGPDLADAPARGLGQVGCVGRAGCVVMT